MLGWVAMLGCGCAEPGAAPRIVAIEDQVALVGEPLLLTIIASDPEDEPLSYEFFSATLLELPRDAAIVVTPDGQALFSWTPIAADLGQHLVDFIVSDGEHDTHAVVPFDVRGAVGDTSAPTFRLPLGEGLVHDLAMGPCIDPAVAIEVHDPDDLEISLTAPGLIDGSTLVVAPDGLTASWRWCPSAEQRAEAGAYELVLAADDGVNPPTLEKFTVFLQRADAECPTQRPVLEHLPAAEPLPILADPEIRVVAHDDIGLLSAPVLYWGQDPEALEPILLDLVDGDLHHGTFAATVPNPAVPLGEGEAASVFYRLAVGDVDSCWTLDPAQGIHELEVVHPGGPGAGLCQACSWDAQCGESDDLCLAFGVAAMACGRGCQGPADCADGYTCSAVPLTSVQGAMGRQCIPDAGPCMAQPCEPDRFEPNDTFAAALDSPPLPVGLFESLRLCAPDDDWYRIELDAPAQVLALLQGAPQTDLDLALTDASGAVVVASEGGTSLEELHSGCLAAGTHLLRVHSSYDDVSDYQLSYVTDSGAC